MPSDRRRLLPLSPVARPGRGRRRRAARAPGPGGPHPPRRPAVGTAEDRERLRPPVRLLRHPGLPRLVRLPPAGRRRRRGPVAGGARRARAVPRQRELHLLRQGPRRPHRPRAAAARADRGRGRRAGPGLLPPARRGPAGPARGDGGDARRVRRGTTCPSSTPPPACCAGCGVSAAREAFLELLERVRYRQPQAGARSNVIVGFPGETEADVDELERFLTAARLDVVGVFGYSDEDGTEAERLDGHLPEQVVAERVERRPGPRRGAHRPARPRAGGRAVRVLVEEHDATSPAPSSGAPTTRARTSTASAWCGCRRDGKHPPWGPSSTARSSTREGVDLVVEPGGGGER